MPRRSILLIVALLVALLGTTAVFAYVRNVDQRAIGNAQPVAVLIAKAAIPAGTSAATASEKGLLTLLTVPRKAVPDGALSDIGSVRTQVTLSDIFPGEMLLRMKFGAQQTTGALNIPAKQLALSVELGDPERVAGFVQPGSEVAVFDTYPIAQPGAAAGSDTKATRLLLARVLVVAVGPTTLRTESSPSPAPSASSQDKPVTTAILTLAVSQADAERLVQAAQTGQLYFGLLAKDSVTGPSRGVNNSTLFG